MLLQGYQTLVREMATPTLPDFVTACLQLIKPPASGKPLQVPLAFVDTVACSLSKLVVLYPTTLRPSAPQMRAALRAYVAPTLSDASIVPQSLQESTRRLFILLSYTAPKNGSSDEWAKAFRATVLDAHATVDQIFRAVVESWESTTGHRTQSVRPGPYPSGGGDSPEDLPHWTGVQAGAQRLVGLLDFLADYFHNPTKAPVTLPLGELLDLTARITLVTPPSGADDAAIETNPAIGRDEKAELWTALPDIHTAVLRLHHALIRRLRDNALPLATDILDQTVRVSTASQPLPAVRETAYALATSLLPLAGPTLPKLTTASLAPLIQSACHDILLPTGHLQPPPAKPTTLKPTQASTNADAYTPNQLNPQTNPTTTTETASRLLPHLLSHLPQSTLPPDLRSLLDRTAILAHHKQAMLASVLHPYRDSRGRYYPSILPFLVRQFPRDGGVEVLRGNLVRWGGAGGERHEGWELGGGEEMGGKGEEEMEEVEEEVKEGEEKEEKEKAVPVVVSGWEMDVDEVAAEESANSTNPFATVVQGESETTAAAAAVPLKRKSERIEAGVGKPAKRVDTGKPAPVQQVAVMPPKAKPVVEEEESGAESDSEGSVQIDMTLDDDEEEEEDEEDE